MHVTREWQDASGGFAYAYLSTREHPIHTGGPDRAVELRKRLSVTPPAAADQGDPLLVDSRAKMLSLRGGSLWLKTLERNSQQEIIVSLAETGPPFAPVDFPVFIGDPQAPTPPLGDNDTSIATTAFVQAAFAGHVVNTIVDLRALPVPIQSTVVDMLGYWYQGDGGGGSWRWTTSSEITNIAGRVSEDAYGGIIVAPNADPTGASGAWIRMQGGRLSTATGIVLTEGYRNVKWYGARGDNVNDDQPRIQAAIDSVSTRDVYVFIPQGLYVCLAPLTVGEGTTLKGEKSNQTGTKSSKLSFTNNTHGIVAPASPTYTGRCVNLQILDLWIGGTATYASNNTKGIWFRNNPYAAGGTKHVEGAKVTGCNLFQWSIGIDMAGQADSIWVNQCLFGTLNTGIRDANVDTVVNNCFWYDINVRCIDACGNRSRFTQDELIDVQSTTTACIGVYCRTADQFAVTGVTRSGTTPVSLTVAGHAFVTGETVYVTGLGGSTQLNDEFYGVTVVDANTISLDGTDSSTVSAWTAGGLAYSELGIGEGTAITACQFGGQGLLDDVVLDGVKGTTIVGNAMHPRRHAVRLIDAGFNTITGNSITIWGAANLGATAAAIKFEGTSSSNLIVANAGYTPAVFGTRGIEYAAGCRDNESAFNTWPAEVTAPIVDNDGRNRFATRTLATTTTIVTVANTVAETELNHFDVLPVTLATGRTLCADYELDYLNNTAGAVDLTLIARLGETGSGTYTAVANTNVMSIANSATRRMGRFAIRIAARGAASQEVAAQCLIGPASVVGGMGTPAANVFGGHNAATADSTLPMTAYLNVIHGTASASVSVRLLAAKVWLE